MKTVTDWDNNITNYEYDGNGQLTKTSRPDGSVEVRTYDAAGRLVSQEDKNGETVINTRDYSYDEAGNISNVEMSYGTDFNGLTSAEMEYDACNRLIKFNGKTVEYDADGNMTYGPLNGEMVTFTYDCRNRLVSAGGISYEYDAENNRISQANETSQTNYVVDTVMPLSRVLTSEIDGVTTYYVYGTGVISQEKDGEWLFYHFNNIGSTEAVTDLDGTIVERFEYGPYGELTSENSCGIIFLCNGEYGVSTDANGLYHMRARYYNPEIKRFINQDILIGTIADSPSMNRYAYVQGNPISLADPFGLSPQLSWGGLGHAALSITSLLMFVPTPLTFAIGASAAIANTAWYASEGNYFEAVCSALTVFGGATSILGTLGKAGQLSATGCRILNLTKTMSCVGSIAVGGYDIYRIYQENYEKYVVRGEEFSFKDTALDVLRGGLDIVAIYGGAKGLGLDKVNVPRKLKGSIYNGDLTGGKNKLSNFQKAQIDPNKISNYALNPEHPVGGNKARVFDSALGYNQSNANELIAQIRKQLPKSNAVLGVKDQFGQRYTIDMLITGANGNTATVRTGWIFDVGSEIARLTTLFVK